MRFRTVKAACQVHRKLHCSAIATPTGLSLYKILFHFKALLWESIICFLPPPTCKAYPIVVLLHDHCAIYASSPTPPLYDIHHIILVMTTSYKGQGASKPYVGHMQFRILKAACQVHRKLHSSAVATPTGRNSRQKRCFVHGHSRRDS